MNIHTAHQLICPWWLCFTFDNPLRKLIHNPAKILGQYVRPGNTVIDIGPGMGYFTIPLCKLAGDTGKVYAVDIQEKMLRFLQKRAEKAGVSKPLSTILSSSNGFHVNEKAAFVLTFWMVHEVPDQKKFLSDIRLQLKPGGTYLLAEPRMHVSKKAFDKTIETAKSVGLIEKARPAIAISRSILFSAG